MFVSLGNTKLMETACVPRTHLYASSRIHRVHKKVLLHVSSALEKQRVELCTQRFSPPTLIQFDESQPQLLQSAVCLFIPNLLILSTLHQIHHCTTGAHRSNTHAWMSMVPVLNVPVYLACVNALESTTELFLYISESSSNCSTIYKSLFYCLCA